VIAALPVVALETPGRAAICETAEERSRLTCWRPADGLTMSMSGVGPSKPVIDVRNRGRYAHARVVLLYGTSLRVRAYGTCTSDRTGLTCRNSDRHGWWIGRKEGFRIF
jgi:hypothetical protein